MKQILRLSLVLLLTASFGCLVGIGCNIGGDVGANAQSPPPVATTEGLNNLDNPKIFEDLRRQALAVKAEDLNLNLSTQQVSVYGVVMDWDMPEGVATTIAFSTGDASLYNSAVAGSSAVMVIKMSKTPPKNCYGKLTDSSLGPLYQSRPHFPKRTVCGFFF